MNKQSQVQMKQVKDKFFFKLSSTQIELLRDIASDKFSQRRRTRYETLNKVKKLGLVEFKNVDLGEYGAGGEYFLTELGKEYVKTINI